MKCENRTNKKTDSVLKFSSRDKLTILVESLIREENINWVISTGFKPSDATQCPRRLVYRAFGNNPDQNSGVSYLDKTNDNFLRAKWVEILGRCRKIKVLEESATVSDGNFNITDIIDFVANIDGIINAVKIYGVDNKDFLKIQKDGAFKKHVIELMIQIWLLEIKDGLLIYENKNDQSYTMFHIEPYQPIISSVKKKYLGLMEHKIQGTLPEKPYKTKTSKECERCEFIKTCWGEII